MVKIVLLPTFAPSSNKDGSRHTQQIDKPILQHFGMWGGVKFEEAQKGEIRTAYGTRLIHLLADRLKVEYGDGYGKGNLAYFRQFYLMFSDLEILHKHVQNLEWSHI